ncbi:MAG: MazG-like family protein [Sporolactobacillus sp.]
MNLNEFQESEKIFYQKRGWMKLPPYIRIGFLMEEVGEVSRAVRAYEIGRDHPGENKLPKQAIKENLAEEMGDVLSNLSILAALYDLTLEDLVQAHRQKLGDRYSGEKEKNE